LRFEGDLVTRLLLWTCQYSEDVRRVTRGTFGRGESRFAIRRGEVVDPVLPEDGREAEDEEPQPMPDKIYRVGRI
jgi:hypothetical protein